MQSAISPVSAPKWLPLSAKTYLRHTLHGVSIRALARQQGCHASTILRQIRKFESRRDDPLVDEALERLSQHFPNPTTEHTYMSNKPVSDVISDATVMREARRILRRLCETDAFLLVSPQMDVAAVFKEQASGRPNRIAVVDREVAHAFALKEWIEGEQLGRVGRYSITTVGRKALKRMLSEDRAQRNEAPSSFQDQHKVFAEREVRIEGSKVKTLRFNLAESPLTLLARKKDKAGVYYLSEELLAAGERLREDFEQAQLGPRVAQNWDRFLTGGGTSWNSDAACSGPSGARERVSFALHVMGPGLADVALRVCCFLEGLEKAEKRLGWSARSGKVVLKIALQRLADHYGFEADAQRRAS